MMTEFLKFTFENMNEHLTRLLQAYLYSRSELFVIWLTFSLSVNGIDFWLFSL